jgi:hypothetical protein
MLDMENIKNVFALIGIFWVSGKIVVSGFSFYNEIHLWGIKKGINKWMHP